MAVMGPPSVYRQGYCFKTEIQKSDNREQKGKTKVDIPTNVNIAYAKEVNKPILCDKGDHVESNTFMAVNVKSYIDSWKMLTSDTTILTAINGYKLIFSSSLLS